MQEKWSLVDYHTSVFIEDIDIHIPDTDPLACMWFLVGKGGYLLSGADCTSTLIEDSCMSNLI